MRRILRSLVITALVMGGVASSARAEDQRPTVFDFAYQGLLVGAGAGLAGGYLVARDGGWHTSSDWKPLAYGAGIGALVGSGIGLTLGVIDVAQDKPGRTHYVLRDMALGEAFGATVGVIAGGLAAISSKKGEHVLLGASIGLLSGAVLGGVFGFFEGGRVLDRGGPKPENRRAALSVVPVVEAGGTLAFLPAISGRY
jgi:hypothetical protein